MSIRGLDNGFGELRHILHEIQRISFFPSQVNPLICV